MNRWHPPEIKTPPVPRVHVPEKSGGSVALEMQLRALRDALDRAVRACELAQDEAKSLREALLCERLKTNEMQARYKDMQRFHNATTVGEVEALQRENRRLRTALADACREHAEAVQAASVKSATEPPPAPREPELGDVTIEPSAMLPRYSKHGHHHG